MDMPLARIHRLALPMLRCQLAKLREPGAGGAADKWRKALVAEVKALEADRYRLPWRDGVPAVLEASLKPYRERLEAGYSRMANLFEIAVDQRWGSRGRANN